MKEFREEEEELDAKTIKRTKFLIWCKVCVVSLAFLFMFTSFAAMQNLHSSINKEDNLGTASLAILYATIVATALITPAPMISILGYKWTIVVSMVCYAAYMALNFYPSWATLIPGSMIIGLGASSLWTAKCGLLTSLGREYAILSKEDISVVITRFFGIFFLFFQSSQVWGNLISSSILKSEVINGSINEETLAMCGANMCVDVLNNTNLEKPSEKQFNTMMGIFVGCSGLAVIMIIFLLPKEKQGNEKANKKPICESIKISLKSTFRQALDKRQILLLPITIFSGMEQAFKVGDYTKSYVSCALGIGMIGYVMICFGIVDSLVSWGSSRIRKYTGRIPLFIYGAIVYLALLIALELWSPHPSQLPVFFIISGLWGSGDAIWQTQVNALYGSFFGVEADAAFSYYRLAESLGFIVAFAYSGLLCTSVKIYIMIAVLTLSMICYFIAENVEKRRITPNIA